MTAVREVKEGMTYNPDTGSYTVRDVAGSYIGGTTQPDVAEHWHAYASGCGSRGRDDATTRRRARGSRPPRRRSM